MTAVTNPTKTDLFETVLLLGKMLGLSRSVATVFAILYSYDHALSIEEIVDASGLSKSAVSLALRDLMQLGAVQERGIVGERSRRYSGQANLTHVVTDIVMTRLKYPLSELRDKLDSASGSEQRRHQVRVLLETFDHTLSRITTDHQA